MADKGELISKPLGPEWLTSFSKDAQLDTTTDESSSGRQGQNANGRRVFFPDKMKPRVPLEMLGRSKSSPVLTQETTIPTIPKEVDVFTLLKEKNSFDKNFPTLHARKPASSQPVSITQPLNPNNLTTVEKEPQTAWKPPTASRASSTSQLPINTVTESKDKKIPTTEEKDIESKLHVPVHSVLPVPVTAKPRNKVELVSPKKPTPSSVKPLPPDSHSPKNRRFDPSLLRKACSEPNLPLNMVDAANYEIKLMPPKARPPSNLSSNRNDFFQNLIKKEQQRLAPSQISPTDTLRITPPVNQPQLKPTEECTAEFRGDSTNGTLDDVPQTNLPNDPQDDSDESQNNKLPQVSEEDEERFLRDLGWVPEEESHVPELTEEEILEVKNRLLDVKEHRSLPSAKLALDVSVKKWQHDKFFTPLSLSSVDAST